MAAKKKRGPTTLKVDKHLRAMVQRLEAVAAIRALEEHGLRVEMLFARQAQEVEMTNDPKELKLIKLGAVWTRQHELRLVLADSIYAERMRVRAI